MTLTIKSKFRYTFMADVNQMADILSGKITKVIITHLDGRVKNTLEGVKLRRVVMEAERNWKGKFAYWVAEIFP